MRNNLSKLIFSVLFCAFYLLLFAPKAGAKAVSYRAVKYGTRQTSMAAGYYAQPAQVKAAGDHYQVTMTIHTKKSLSKWPVKVINVAGQSPQNVVKSQSAGYYDYRYTFTSKLQGPINSYISIDVPGVYKANHYITFIFNASQLPRLKAKRHAPAAASSKEQHPHQTKTEAKPSVQKTSGESSQDNPRALKQLAANKRNRDLNQKNQRLFYYILLVGSLLLLVVIVCCALVLFSAKKKRKLSQNENKN